MPVHTGTIVQKQTYVPFITIQGLHHEVAGGKNPTQNKEHMELSLLTEWDFILSKEIGL